MNINKLPSQEKLKGLLIYDENTGFFSWAANGKRAGTTDGKGYVRITIDRKFYGAHRLAWMFVHGEDPEKFEIDHVNGLRADNRILNLRKVTRQQNNMNMRSRGQWPKGVYKHRSKFVAQIKFKGEGKYLGSFGTPEEAHEVYVKEAEKLFGEFKCLS